MFRCNYVSVDFNIKLNLSAYVNFYKKWKTEKDVHLPLEIQRGENELYMTIMQQMVF